MQRVFKNKLLRIVVILTVSAISVCSSYLDIKAETEKYLAAGIPFGISIECDGVIVSGYSEMKENDPIDNPAIKAGLKIGDIIKYINGEKAENADTVTKIINGSLGKDITLRVSREGVELDIKAIPQKCADGIYRLGINIKDTISGIGTITYISTENGMFGGLGHGICDPHTGQVIPMKKGTITDVKINNINKGKNGLPGEIRGSFSTNRTGAAISNTNLGIFGILNHYKNYPELMYEIAEEGEVKCGNAEVICTIDDQGPKKYSVIIESCDVSKDTKTRNFTVKVTDKELISKTGGIIQGMSGSPLIQNNKLVGAITHVLVNDPTRGYGIFIRNMIEQQQ